LIDKLAAEHRIDPKRIYLFGFSLGGIGSWEVALDQPERFAAVVPIGGYMGSPADAGRLKNVPVWVFNGENDPTTTVQAATLMVEALRKAGGKPQFTILPGKSHGDSQDAAYGYPDLFEWMLAQRRE
jgi:predicted peptidase